MAGPGPEVYTTNDCFPTRPMGGTQMPQYCVTALMKDRAIHCGLRLVLEHLGTSEPAIITLEEYYIHYSAVEGSRLPENQINST